MRKQLKLVYAYPYAFISVSWMVAECYGTVYSGYDLSIIYINSVCSGPDPKYNLN
jgi:hypothetical protein